MAEFEKGHCTGCGYNVLRWGHRPYCWRVVSMMLNLHPTHDLRQSCLKQMRKHWRIRSLFLAKQKHMYSQIGDPAPEPSRPIRHLLREDAGG